MESNLEKRLSYLSRINNDLLVTSVSPRLEYFVLRLYGWDNEESINKIEKRYQTIIEDNYKIIGGF